MAFMNDTNSLKYAHWIEGSGWQIHLVDTDGDAGYPTAIQTDSMNVPHIMHPDPDCSCIRHFWYDGTNWLNEEVVSIPSDYEQPIAYLIDGSGQHYLAWRNIDDYSLGYAIGETSNWQIGIIDVFMINVGEMSLTMDALNKINLTYNDLFNGDLYYAQFRGDIWYNLGLGSTRILSGNSFLLTREIHNTTGSDLTADEYVLLDVYGEYWFAPTWTQEAQFQVTGTGPNSVDAEIPLDFFWPSGAGSASGIRFWGGIVESGTANLIDYDMVEFEWAE